MPVLALGCTSPGTRSASPTGPPGAPLEETQNARNCKESHLFTRLCTCGVRTCMRAATMKHKTRQPRTTVCYAQTERVGVGDQHPVVRMACRPPSRLRHGMGAGEKRVTV